MRRVFVLLIGMAICLAAVSVVRLLQAEAAPAGVAGAPAGAATAEAGEAAKPEEGEAAAVRPADLPAPGGEKGWLPLDLSQHMNRDIIQTPNEWLRCLQISLDEIRSSANPQQTALKQRLTVNRVFGDHSMIRWSSVCYHVVGRYPSICEPAEQGEAGATFLFTEQNEGLPVDGRIGPFRLYMDELESSQWRLACEDSVGDGGRNAIGISRPRQDRQVVLDLVPAERRRYRALNLLFAAGNFDCRNFVRLLAEYEDGHKQLLYQGMLMEFTGAARWPGDRREYDQPVGQIEYFGYQNRAGGSRTVAFNRSYGNACLNTFEKPLPLDPQRTLKALHVETVGEMDGKMVSGESWSVVIMAAIVLPVGE